MDQIDDRHDTDETPELRMLAAARPEPGPGADMVDRHRSALATAMVSAKTSAPASSRWNPLTRRRLAIAATTVPLLAAAAGLAATRSTAHSDSRKVTIETELAASHAFYDAPRCGTEPPPDLFIPEGYDGPFDGPSPDSDVPPQPDQLVRHWTSPTGTIELRWYADGAAEVPTDPTDLRPSPPNGRHWSGWVFQTSIHDDDPCSFVQFLVFDDTEAQMVATLNAAAQNSCLWSGPTETDDGVYAIPEACSD